MSTLLERACGFGDGASEMIELEALRTALVLTGQDIITATRAKALLGLTPEQGNEFDAMMELQPGTLLERVTWADRIVITIDGARRGLEALDSESNIRFALGLPELVPPENV